MRMNRRNIEAEIGHGLERYATLWRHAGGQRAGPRRGRDIVTIRAGDSLIDPFEL